MYYYYIIADSYKELPTKSNICRSSSKVYNELKIEAVIQREKTYFTRATPNLKILGVIYAKIVKNIEVIDDKHKLSRYKKNVQNSNFIKMTQIEHIKEIKN